MSKSSEKSNHSRNECNSFRRQQLAEQLNYFTREFITKEGPQGDRFHRHVLHILPLLPAVRETYICVQQWVLSGCEGSEQGSISKWSRQPGGLLLARFLLIKCAFMPPTIQRRRTCALKSCCAPYDANNFKSAKHSAHMYIPVYKAAITSSQHCPICLGNCNVKNSTLCVKYYTS